MSTDQKNPAYKELLAQRAELDRQIEEVRRAELGTAIAKARELIEEFGLTSEDIFGASKKKARGPSGVVAPKYKNPATGETWTGRGKPPAWIRDKNRDEFLIAA